MELRHLRDFVAIAEEGSFTRAATRIRVAQPSLTRQMKNLEEELGVQLLNRGNSGVSLTREGHAFLLNAKRILAMSAESIETLQHMKHRCQSQLNIGYIANLHCGLVTKTLAYFRREQPNVGLNLFDMTSMEQLSAVKEGKLDLALIGPEVVPSDYAFQLERIAQHDVLVALPQRHSLSKKSRLARDDLTACFVVGFSEKYWPGWRDWIDQVFGSSALNRQILQEADTETAALRLVALGLGIAFIPDQIRLIPHAGVRFRPLTPELKISSSIAWKGENDSEYLRQYIQILRRSAAG